MNHRSLRASLWVCSSMHTAEWARPRSAWLLFLLREKKNKKTQTIPCLMYFCITLFLRHSNPLCSFDSPHVGEVISREPWTQNKTENWAQCCKTSTTAGVARKGPRLRPYTSSVVAAAAAAAAAEAAASSTPFIFTTAHRDTQASLPRPHWCSQLWLLPLFGYVNALSWRESIRSRCRLGGSRCLGCSMTSVGQGEWRFLELRLETGFVWQG